MTELWIFFVIDVCFSSGINGAIEGHQFCKEENGHQNLLTAMGGNILKFSVHSLEMCV